VKRSLLAVFAALATLAVAAPAQGACIASVRLGAESYVGSSIPARDGAALRGGVIPGCNDVVVTDANGNDVSPRNPDTPIELHRIAGVPARLAVAYNGRTYFARGYLPQLASHHLHAAWAQRNRVEPSSCGKPWFVRATLPISPTPGPIPVHTAGGRDTFLQLDARSEVTGLDRAGFPYLAEGQGVRALVRSCSSVFGGRVLLARRVTRS